jgi:hypothetical protein
MVQARTISARLVKYSENPKKRGESTSSGTKQTPSKHVSVATMASLIAAAADAVTVSL